MRSEPIGSGARAELLTRIDDLVEELQPRLVEWRRDLHAHPEPSRAEHRTTARIRGVLESLGLEAHSLEVPTGLYADVLPDGSRRVPRIGLRADIDALSLVDQKDVPYRSTHTGVAHACGHDVHTAVLLGAAEVLVRLREQGLLNRGVRLLFQPAEETSPGGALDMVGQGLLKDLREVYALHCDPRTEVGRVAIRTGAITSACDRFQVTFSGPGGHSSRPHLSADLVMAIGAVITEVPTLLSRRIDPRVGASMVWGQVQAGNAPNAIPASGQLSGTLRCLQLEGWQRARDLVPQLIEQVAAPYGVSVQVDRSTGIPPTVNHAAAAGRLAEVCSAVLGPDSLADTEQSLGGEDFSEMVLAVPGALGRLGVRPVGSADWPDLHRPGFDVDEACLGVGVRVLSGLVALRPDPGPRRRSQAA
ncbi:amidohydrolase [Naumannella sp. ID2617S]|nr:amidohydrolase [Naumannella sp. ID2617S]